ncbi:uncharacterized protein ASPGLDRAFT_53625 [Aspergillus glaucus CBS 516.65]|uniref:Uncharacterized protein n=1 Tax=Aspergillus glaucus CBS 516.65 TaxID=1160497 RepID=A0A1L9V3G9_ASPGL|nr:hypothetical protein ASPGLDRAFT_53625 [Aspergillus glaucus CBS 516.65]OJJ78470.1 hypothetical protein ASPGLDRAFT_53625 [Aspergillus glaucus CBS 516.65]
MAQSSALESDKIKLFSLDSVDFNPGMWFATFAVTRHLRYKTLINAYGMNNYDHSGTPGIFTLHTRVVSLGAQISMDFQQMGQSCDDTIKLADSAAQIYNDIFDKISTYKKNKETDHARFYKENAENAIKAQQHSIQQASYLFQTTSESLDNAIADIPGLKPLADSWCTWYQAEARKDIHNGGVNRLLGDTITLRKSLGTAEPSLQSMKGYAIAVMQDFQVTHDWVKVDHLDKSDVYLAQLHKSVLVRWDGRKQDAQNFKDTVFAYWNPRVQEALNGSHDERTANDNPGPK